MIHITNVEIQYVQTYMEEIKKQGALAVGGDCYASKWFTFDENYSSPKKK